MATNSTLYSYCSTLTVGCPVWITPERTTVAPNGIYSTFDYSTQGTRYVTVSNGTITSIDNLCPIGPGSVIATVSGYGTGIIEVSRGENSTSFTPFHTVGRDWIEAKSSVSGQVVVAIRNLLVPEQAGKVEASFNYGATFSNISSGINPSHNPVSLAVNASGSIRVVATSPGYIYHNLGTPPPNGDYFKAELSIGFRNWTAVVANSSGNVVIAAASDGTVWRYVNGTWAQSAVGAGSNSWTCLGMNYDGSITWLAGNETHLYRSTDVGQNFVQIPITVTIPNVGNVSSPFNFSNIATDDLGNNSVATVEPTSNSGGLSFIAKNFIGGSVNYNNWSWAWGRTPYYPYNQVPNGSWTGLTTSSNAFTIYAANNSSTQGGIYVSQDNGATFYNSTYVKPYSSVSHLATSVCPANGTLLEQYCDGTTWTQVYANGSCGTYITVEYNSANCQSQTCDTYSVFDYGGVSYVDCYGISQFNYFVPGDFFCALSLNYGPAYLYQAGCNNPGVLNPI